MSSDAKTLRTPPAELVEPDQVPDFLLEVAGEDDIRRRTDAWRARLLRRPGLIDHAARAAQGRIAAVIPERVHAVVTAGVEAMTRGILTGAAVLRARPAAGGSLASREARALGLIRSYRNAGAVEGGVAGAGGMLLAAADFPALLAIKVRMLSDLVSVYGWGGDDPAERLFLLHVFHLAFAGPHARPAALKALEDWIEAPGRTGGLADYDWRGFQQSYRDYIDLAKLAQMIPVVGAPIGAVVNWRLIDRLGETAMMACRLRWFAETSRLPEEPDRGSMADPDQP